MILKDLKQFLSMIFARTGLHRWQIGVTDHALECESGMTRRHHCHVHVMNRDDIGPWTRRRDLKEIRQGRAKEDRINGSLERKWREINYCSCKRWARNSPLVINCADWWRL